jgi:hypothetical protein
MSTPAPVALSNGIEQSAVFAIRLFERCPQPNRRHPRAVTSPPERFPPSPPTADCR